jgi:hypothetical protein
VLTAAGPSWSNAPNGSHANRNDAIGPEPLDGKILPLEFDAGVPNGYNHLLRHSARMPAENKPQGDIP